MKQTLARGTAPLLIAVLVAAAASSANAQTVPIPDFFSFSGGETFIRFDGLGLVDGDEVPNIAGADFMLSDGARALYAEEFVPHEMLPPNPGALNNNRGLAAPLDLLIHFPGVVHRVAFEMTADPMDDLVFTFVSSGGMVDQVVVPSRGSNLFYFYGFENMAGFDELHVSAGSQSGMLSLDNMLFETLDVGEVPPEPEPEPELAPALVCEGFTDPFDEALAMARERGYPERWIARVERWLGMLPARERRAELFDGDGVPMMGDSLMAAPVVQVLFTPAGAEESVDVAADVVWGDMPVLHFDDDKGYWRMILDRRRMRAPGTYQLSVHSGDESEYVIDPTCEESYVEEMRSRRPWRWGGHDRHKHREHDRHKHRRPHHKHGR